MGEDGESDDLTRREFLALATGTASAAALLAGTANEDSCEGYVEPGDPYRSRHSYSVSVAPREPCLLPAEEYEVDENLTENETAFPYNESSP